MEGMIYFFVILLYFLTLNIVDKVLFLQPA